MMKENEKKFWQNQIVLCCGYSPIVRRFIEKFGIEACAPIVEDYWGQFPNVHTEEIELLKQVRQQDSKISKEEFWSFFKNCLCCNINKCPALKFGECPGKIGTNCAGMLDHVYNTRVRTETE